MNKEEMWMTVSITGVVLSVILAWAMPYPWLRLIFIACSVLTAVSSYIIRKSGSKEYLPGMIISIAGMGCILAASIVIAGSPAAYFNEVALLFRDGKPQGVKEENMSEEESLLYDAVDNALAENDVRQQRLDQVSVRISNMNSNMETMLEYQEEQSSWKEKKNPTEIEKVLQIIDQEYKKREESFTELKTNEKNVELFYKIFLSNIPYAYCNIISAMEAYGIDCEEFSIDERKLVVWDTEMLFVCYSILDSLGMDIAQDITYEANAEVDGKPVRKYIYNQYRIMDRNRYSDTLNYNSWYWYSSDLSAQKIGSQIDTRIMKYYKKFLLNFS